MKLRNIALACLAFLALADVLRAQVAAKASYVPSDLDVSLDGQALLQRKDGLLEVALDPTRPGPRVVAVVR